MMLYNPEKSYSYLIGIINKKRKAYFQKYRLLISIRQCFSSQKLLTTVVFVQLPVLKHIQQIIFFS